MCARAGRGITGQPRRSVGRSARGAICTCEVHVRQGRRLRRGRQCRGRLCARAELTFFFTVFRIRCHGRGFRASSHRARTALSRRVGATSTFGPPCEPSSSWQFPAAALLLYLCCHNEIAVERNVFTPLPILRCVVYVIAVPGAKARQPIHCHWWAILQVAGEHVAQGMQPQVAQTPGPSW